MSETSVEEEEDRKIVELRLIQGGKTRPPKDSWLRNFGDGGVFTARRKKPMEGEDPAGASSFYVFVMLEHSACLELRLWDSDMLRDRVFRRWYTIDLFSKEWELLDIIDEGQCDRPNIVNGLVQYEEHDGEERDAGVDEDTGQPSVQPPNST